MSHYVRFCKNCDGLDKEQEKVIRGRYSTFLDEDNYICEVCGNKVVNLSILSEDYKVIINISNSPKFIQDMIGLSVENPIEYQLKISQFKVNLIQTQNEQNKINQVKCPTCSSTNVKRISGTAKVAGFVTFGLFSKTARSQFKCQSCGYKW